MSKVVYNIGQIESEMMKIGERVIERVSERILSDFIKDYVLGIYKPSKKLYHNSGVKFKDAWDWKPIVKSSYSISKEMFYDYERTNSEPTAFDDDEPRWSGFGIHGSLHWEDTTDVRELMPAIMNEEYKSTHPMTYDRPYQYWDKFIAEYVDGGKLKRIIDEIAMSEGLSLGNK